VPGKRERFIQQPVFFRAVPAKFSARAESSQSGSWYGIRDLPYRLKFCKKTRMKSKTSHPSNENFALRIQFPVELSIVDKTQNFHDKGKGIRQSTHPSPAKKMIYSEPVQGPDS